MKRDELRSIQAPLKERYEGEPEAGLHPASGADGSLLCSGDMLQTLIGSTRLSTSIGRS